MTSLTDVLTSCSQRKSADNPKRLLHQISAIVGLAVYALNLIGCSQQGRSTAQAPQPRSETRPIVAGQRVVQTDQAQTPASPGLDLHAKQPFGDNPALICTHPEVISALTMMALKSMRAAPALFAPKEEPPPDDFFADQAHASLTNVTMKSYDPTSMLLKCDGDFTVELSSEAAGQAARMGRLAPPTSQTDRISYQVQPFADRSDILIGWSQDQSADYGALGLPIWSTWEAQQKRSSGADGGADADTSNTASDQAQ